MSTPEETVIILLDSYWFDYGVFSAKSSVPLTTPNLNQLQQEKQESEKPKLNRINTQMRKSLSDQFLSSKDFSNSSPNSVLTPQLQTILSGKETKDLSDSNPVTVKFCPETERDEKKRKSRKKRGSSRSLSELEFEEVKGFMDLGFVFSDEDKDSKLVSIIPGLHRFGKNDQVDESDSEQPLLVSRPYLSEAWDCLEEEEDEKRKKNSNPLMDRRIPSFRNEMELKNHLRFWAHTVASLVR